MTIMLIVRKGNTVNVAFNLKSKREEGRSTRCRRCRYQLSQDLVAMWHENFWQGCISLSFFTWGDQTAYSRWGL